jgi:glycosyltransferase involved in cell wall biosynthesis
MPDLAGPDWREQRGAAQAEPGPPRILMIGHLRGIGTISGLHLFVPQILPALTRELGADGFEVHVVGGQDPPAAFADALRTHPAVRLRGQISRPEHEFFRSHVLLAPNPTTTGASARILSGLTFGSCIVAHTDSVVGIPELEHGANSLMAADGAALARHTLAALRDGPLRDRLGDEARRLYEAAFSPGVAAGRLVEEVERLAGARTARDVEVM